MQTVVARIALAHEQSISLVGGRNICPETSAATLRNLIACLLPPPTYAPPVRPLPTSDSISAKKRLGVPPGGRPQEFLIATHTWRSRCSDPPRAFGRNSMQIQPR